MDVYGLKTDALGYWQDEISLEKQGESSKRAVKIAENLYRACESTCQCATSKDIEARLKDEIDEYSVSMRRDIYGLIDELGYEFSRERGK